MKILSPMKISGEIVKKKAELISNGKIYIPTDVIIPFPFASSSAGPSAGNLSLSLKFGASRVKLTKSRQEESPFSLKKENGKFVILKNDLHFSNVEIIPTILHAPEQAFINITNKCIYSCKFCASPKLKTKKEYSLNKWIKLIQSVSKREDFHSIAITTGIAESVSKSIDDVIFIVKALRKKLEDTPIGVEVYTEDVEDLKRLREAGCDELKLNIQSFDREIFKKICPEWDYYKTLKIIKSSREIFDKVASNIIIGLGESDENVVEGIETLAAFGVLATIRKIRVNKYNRLPLIEAVGELPEVNAQRLVMLAKKQKEIFERYGLDTRVFDSMCHRCGCCDLVPGLDF